MKQLKVNLHREFTTFFIKTIMRTVSELKEIIKPICREYKVKQLDLIGSRARGTATKQSDIDLLVEFEEPFVEPANLYFGLLHSLEDTEI